MKLWSHIREGMQTRNPWVAATLNFVAWGLGYIFAGRRKLLGLALFAFLGGNYLGGVAYVTEGISQAQVLAISLFLWFFLGLALARDAYLEAVERNQGVEIDEQE